MKSQVIDYTLATSPVAEWLDDAWLQQFVNKLALPTL